MAYKKDIKPLLKELGYTWEQMQGFWDGCIEVNYKVSALSKAGKNWNDLDISQIRELPYLKQKTLDAIEKRQKEEEEKQRAEEKEKQDEEYYWEHFDEIMVRKIDNGEKLTEEELKNVVYETKEIACIEGDTHRWTRDMETIVEMCGRYFCVNWGNGLTEYQENEFHYQPYEVEKVEHEKTITVTEWKKKLN